MKKEALIIALIVLITLNISFANALINETKQINEAYDWLEDQVRNNWQSLDTLQHEFALLAIAYKTDLKNQGFNYLRQKGWPQGNPVCWGKNAVNNEKQCKIKESAIASFIYSEFDQDYSKINEWLLNQSSLFKDIQWYLQVDIERGLNASCNVTYGTGENFVFEIKENKSLSYVSGSRDCLNIYQGNWLEIKSSCYDKDFKLTCKISDPTETYKVGFLYKKSSQDNEWHASDFSYTIDSSDYVDISIRDISICLADPQGQCDYEANAIAAYVLKQQGNAQYAALMPFLVINAQEQENVKKNSYAWLYLLTGNGRYGDLVLSSENIQGFWNLLSGFGQFYDTAISGYSLIQNYNADYNASETKEYLLSRQKKEGYWLCSEIGCEKIRDTALLLYVFWPRAIARGGEGGYVGNACEDAGGTCDLWCDPEAGFIEDPSLSYDCGNYLCCIPTSSLSCYDPLINGELCDANEVCVNGYNITTTETLQELGYCCYNGTCQAATQSCDEQNGYICDQVNSFCPPGYEIAATGLSEGQVCCQLACQSCSDIGGKVCENDEICQGESKGECCLGDCIKNAECSDLGGESCSETGWSCDGELIKTLDTDYCCINGNCIKSCEEEGGQICFEDEVCDGDEIEASDLKAGEICCIGECKKKAGFNWGLVILFLILIALIVGSYFLYKKGKLQALFKRKGKPPEGPSIFKAPTKPTTPALPRTLPTLPRQPQPTIQKVPPIKPRPLPKATPKPIPIAKPQEKPIEIPKEKPKEKKAKSKTEEQLEKTLKRIKELTK